MLSCSFQKLDYSVKWCLGLLFPAIRFSCLKTWVFCGSIGNWFLPDIHLNYAPCGIVCMWRREEKELQREEMNVWDEFGVRFWGIPWRAVSSRMFCTADRCHYTRNNLYDRAKNLFFLYDFVFADQPVQTVWISVYSLMQGSTVMMSGWFRANMRVFQAWESNVCWVLYLVKLNIWASVLYWILLFTMFQVKSFTVADW